MIIATNQITIASLNDGVGIATTIVEYALSSSGTTPPGQILEDESHNEIVSNEGDPLTDGDWYTTVPNIPQGYYLWTRTRFVLSDGSFDNMVYAVSYYSEDGQDGSSVSNVVPEYRLSNSRSSLTGSGAGYTWSEVKPECGENQYIWSRQKTTLSGPNGTTTVYSNAVCDIVLSDVVFDVNKANKSITEKVWQSDIESQINEYDGSTAQSIRDRVAQTETDINGINTTVSSVQSTLDTKADGSTVSTLSSQVSTLQQDVTGFKTTVSDTYATKADMNHFNVFIVGTQTAVTGAWIGTTNEISSLEDGQAITYWLPYNGSGNATLNLTLKDGTTTGAIPCYYSGTSRITTHYAAGNVIHLTYRTNVTIDTTTISAGWWADANYNTNNYDRTKYNGVVKAAVNIPRYSIAVGTSAGFKPLNSGAAFNIEYPILYLQDGEIKQNESKANGYTVYPATITTTQALDLTPGLPLYIKGTLSGRTFTPISTAPITQTVPNSEDGKHYMFLGTAYGTATTVRTFYLLQDHPIYMYKGEGPLGGEDVGFVKIETAAMTIAEQTAEGFSWIVKSGSSQSSLTLTDSAMTAIAKDINLNGKVTFNSFNSELQTRIGNTESTLSNVVNNSTNQVVTYARNTSSTVAPTGTWYPNPEQTGSDPYLWQKTETKNINNVTTATQIVCITGQKGEPGVAGTSINTASVLLYQRATSAPSKPSGNITYTFDGGTVSGSLGSWQKTIPSGTNPCYVIVATASSTEETDIIAPSEWSNPVVLVQNGTNGTAANNQATILLYQRSATQPSKPSASITYTFSTGALSSTPSGWSRAIPVYQDKNPCWVTSATVISQNASVSIAASAWSDVQKLVEDGNGIINTTVEYAISDSGSITPGIILADENGIPLKDDNGKFLVYGVWSSEPIDPPEGTYLWTKTTQTYSNGEVSVQYSCSKNAVGIKSCVQYYCLSQTQPNTTPLTDKINWSTTPQEYQVGMKYWSCQVTTFNDDTQTVSEIVQESTLDQALKASDIMKKWTDDALLEQVTINGGYIKAHTIETQHLASDTIMSTNYERANANKFSTTGSYFDLENGNIFTPFFSVVNSPYAGSGLTVGASFKAGNPTPGNTGVEILPNGTLTAYGITVGGTIKAGAGEIAGFKIDSTSIRTNDVAVTSNANNSVSLSSANFSRTINGVSRTGLRFAIGSQFGVTGAGAVYMSGATVSGSITATSGSFTGDVTVGTGLHINGSTAASPKIYYNITAMSQKGTKKGFYLGTDGIAIGKGFWVDSDGNTSIKSGTTIGKNDSSSNTYNIVVGENTTGSGTSAKTQSSLQYGKDSLVSNVAGFYLGTDGISIGENNVFQINANGTTGEIGKIGPWKITSTAIYKGSSTMGAANTSTQNNAYFGDNGLSISNKFKVDSGGNAIVQGVISANTFNIYTTENNVDSSLTSLIKAEYIADANNAKIRIGQNGTYGTYITMCYANKVWNQGQALYDDYGTMKLSAKNGIYIVNDTDVEIDGNLSLIGSPGSGSEKWTITAPIISASDSIEVGVLDTTGFDGRLIIKGNLYNDRGEIEAGDFYARFNYRIFYEKDSTHLNETVQCVQSINPSSLGTVTGNYNNWLRFGSIASSSYPWIAMPINTANGDVYVKTGGNLYNLTSTLANSGGGTSYTFTNGLSASGTTVSVNTSYLNTYFTSVGTYKLVTSSATNVTTLNTSYKYLVMVGHKSTAASRGVYALRYTSSAWNIYPIVPGSNITISFSSNNLTIKTAGDTVDAYCIRIA